MTGRPVPRWAVVAAALAAALVACRSEKPGGAAPGERRYTVRGEVVALPAAGAGERQLGLRHEAIDAFVDQTGQVVGMDAMTMRFPLAPSVSLDGVRAGDKVEAVIAVGWSPPSFRIEALRRLPDDTPLTFGKAHPPAARRAAD